MHLHAVDYHYVRKAIERARLHNAETKEFNTSSCSKNAIKYSVPGVNHRVPPSWPFEFGLWQPLITASQGLDGGYQFLLTVSCIEQIIEAAKEFKVTERLSQAKVEDVMKLWPQKAEMVRELGGKQGASSSNSHVPARVVFMGARPWFLRVDFCSIKDAPYQGPVRSLREVTERLCSCPRAAGALGWAMDNDSCAIDKPVVVYLMPFNKHLDTAFEYRCFCPPGNRGISAISQYRWTQPWAEAPTTERGDSKKNGPSNNRTVLTFSDRCRANRIYQAVTRIQKEILAFASDLDVEAQNRKAKTAWDDIPALFRPNITMATTKMEDSQSISAALRRDGFTFDVLETTGKPDIQLIEVNAFGAMSKTSSCLFEWIRDAEVLYGVQRDGPSRMGSEGPIESIDFRVTR